jgi:CIC family chloride channel protein
MVATSLTLSSGGSGGVFAPSLVIGSLAGLFYYKILCQFFSPASFNGSSLFSLVAMAGMLSGTMQAPLAGIFLIVEITGGYDAILPLLLVSFLVTTLVKRVERHSIYHFELVKKGFLLRPRTDARVLSEIKAAELLEKDILTVYPEMSLHQLIPRIKRSRRNHFAVISRQSKAYLGMVNLEDIKPILFDQNLLKSIIVEEVMKCDQMTVSLDENVVDILRKFDATQSWSLPVLEDGRFRGLISKSSILDHYRKELKAQTEY